MRAAMHMEQSNLAAYSYGTSVRPRAAFMGVDLDPDLNLNLDLDSLTLLRSFLNFELYLQLNLDQNLYSSSLGLVLGLAIARGRTGGAPLDAIFVLLA